MMPYIYPSGNVVNLSKHSFSLDTYKLLNKNLNHTHFKRYIKNQSTSDLQNSFGQSNFDLTLKIKPVLQQ